MFRGHQMLALCFSVPGSGNQAPYRGIHKTALTFTCMENLEYGNFTMLFRPYVCYGYFDKIAGVRRKLRSHRSPITIPVRKAWLINWQTRRRQICAAR
jgi:hypothetical protein